jgi:hypothetical protein
MSRATRERRDGTCTRRIRSESLSIDSSFSNCVIMPPIPKKILPMLTPWDESRELAAASAAGESVAGLIARAGSDRAVGGSVLAKKIHGVICGHAPRTRTGVRIVLNLIV